MSYHMLKAGQEPGTYIMENTLVTEEDILTIAKPPSGRIVVTPNFSPEWR